VVDPVRSRSGPWAMEQFSPDVILLDDGFQHLAVRRHLDIVLLSPDDLVRDWNRVNPAGRWREGARALKRAHALLLNRTSGDVSDLSFRLASLDNPWFPFRVRPGGLRSIASGEYRSLGPEQPYLLITGIANPERVFHTAVDLLGRPPVETFLYPDHHAYTETDVAAIRRACDRHGAVAVTTAKDAVKLARFEDERFLVIDLTLDFPPGDHGTFPDWISARLKELKPGMMGCIRQTTRTAIIGFEPVGARFIAPMPCLPGFRGRDESRPYMRISIPPPAIPFNLSDSGPYCSCSKSNLDSGLRSE
jgi:tetraacyldisaccharide 4'-kinase